VTVCGGRCDMASV